MTVELRTSTGKFGDGSEMVAVRVEPKFSYHIYEKGEEIAIRYDLKSAQAVAANKTLKRSIEVKPILTMEVANGTQA